jgi:hypothetical protein
MIMLSNSCGKPQQHDFWWAYLADYDGRPGSTLVNLALKERAPLANFRHLVVTGVSYSSPKADGLPDSKELDWLDALSQKRLKAITQLTPVILSGSFTHNSERLDYIYVSNSTGIEDALKKFYQETCPDRKAYINLKEDSKWEAYSGFLFPNEQTIQFHREELTKIGYLKK